MELVTSLIVGALLIEAYAWLPKITEWLLEQAVGQLPVEDQERCRDEWKAGLDDFPNTIVKLVHALSFQGAAIRISADILEAKIEETDRLLHDITRRHFVAFEQLRAGTVGLDRKRNELKTALQQISIMKVQASANEQHADAAQKAWSALERYGSTLTVLTDRSWELLKVSVESADVRFHHLDGLIKETSNIFHQVLEQSRGGGEPFGVIAKRLASVVSDLGKVKNILEDDNWGDDESLRVHAKIRTAVLCSINSYQPDLRV